MSQPSSPDARHAAAVIATWIFPGLGHWLIGERRRARILACGIGAMWFIGLLIGGVSVIDARKHQWWFLSQMLVAPSVIVDQVRHRALHEKAAPNDQATPGYEPAIGRAAEQGVLYTALAGLMNLLVMIDVVHRPVRDDAPSAKLFGAT